MLTFTFNRGSRISINGEIHTIIWVLPDDRFQLEKEDKSIVLMDRAELLWLYSQQRIEFLTDAKEDGGLKKQSLKRALQTYSTSVSSVAIRRKRYVDLMGQFGTFISSPRILKDRISDCAQAIGDNNPPGTATMYRWWRKFQSSGGDYRSLIDRFSARGRVGQRFDAEVFCIVKDSVDAIYLTTQRESATDVYTDIEARINKINEWRENGEKLKCPSRASVYRYIRGLDQYEVTAARLGKQVADLRFRSSMQGPNTTRILERVEIDHTPLDLFVIDMVTGLPLGRPTVTLVLDKFSRMVLGFHIGFQGTSLEAVYHALRHAILPKTYVREKYPDVKNDWPAYGVFEKLVCDNGIEFHANDLERVAFELGFQIEYCPKRKPYFKGSIERYLKTLNFKLAHSLPGTSFARWFHREDYDSEKHAVIDMQTLQRIVHIWIVDIYHQTIHRGANGIPQQRWIESAKKHPPRLLADAHRLDIAFGRTVRRVVSHRGIELNGGGMYYNNDYLLSLRCASKGKFAVDVTYYVEDLGHIYVVDPQTRESIPVPAVDQEYAKGLSLQQHELIKRHLRDVNQQQVNIAGLAEAKSRIRQIIAELSLSKFARKRQKAAKLRGIGRGDTDLLADVHSKKKIPSKPMHSNKTEKKPKPLASQNFREEISSIDELGKSAPAAPKQSSVTPRFQALQFKPQHGL